MDTGDENLKNNEKSEVHGEYVFTREEIKKRPLNKHKLARNTLLAAVSAVVFGLVATITFALLAPFIMSRINKTSTPAPVVNSVSFPEETVEDEMTPSDMLVSSVEEPEIDLSEFNFVDEDQVRALLNSIKFTVSDYQELYRSLASIASDASKSIVKVTPYKQSTDWFNNINKTATDLTGLIVADNGTSLLILTYSSKLADASSILVTFFNDVQAEAEIVKSDANTGLCVISVPLENINDLTKNNIKLANFGGSSAKSLVGSPVIAIGCPTGTYGSVSYGIVTSNSETLIVTDNFYKHVTTDIYGSTNATGVLINVRGEVIGIIENKFGSNDARNLVSALGITELKKTIEILSNNQPIQYLGITGVDVPDEAVSQYGAPKGVFVLSVEMGSPAMEAGMQSGDIIVGFGEVKTSSFAEFLSVLRSQSTESTTEVKICRAVQDTYKELTLTVQLSEK